MKDSVLIYTENRDIIDELTDEQAGILLKAIMAYQVDQQEQDIDDAVARIAFKAIKKQIDRCNENYEAVRQKRSDAGKKGMAKRWNDNKSASDNNTDVTKDNIAITNDNKAITADNKNNLNVNVNENVNVNDNNPPIIPPQGKPTRHKYGEYNHVLLSDDDYQKLCSEFGELIVTKAIKCVDEYCESSGKTYKNYNLVLRRWGIDRAKEDEIRKARDDPYKAINEWYAEEVAKDDKRGIFGFG